MVAPAPPRQGTGLLRLALTAALAGALTGAVGGSFRAALNWAEPVRERLALSLASAPAWGWIAVALAAAGFAAAARWLVRFEPLAAGSGVQHVEAVARGEAKRAKLRIVFVKFLGGLLSIGGAGLALGREGPTVQMGATIGSECAERIGADPATRRDLHAALAGAGLAVAFNAPLGGAIFVFEELTRKFRLRLGLATLLACAVAVGVARMMLGGKPDFAVEIPHFSGWKSGLVFLALGSFMGVLGVAYNRFILVFADFAAAVKVAPELKAAFVGAIAGIVGWFAPQWAGGGDSMNQTLLSQGAPLGVLAALFAVRWVLGPLSYAAGTPGGLFAPLLLVGSTCGLFFGPLADLAEIPRAALAVAGMAAFFSGVVRAPFTGIVLIAEMTAVEGMLVPLMLACFGAVASATAMKGPPIYDSLRARMLASGKRGKGGICAR